MFHHSGPNGNMYKKSVLSCYDWDLVVTTTSKTPWHRGTVTPWHRNVVTNLYTLYVSQCHDKPLYFICFKGVSCVYISQIHESSSLLSSLVFVYTFLCHLLTDFDDSTGCYSFEVQRVWCSGWYCLVCIALTADTSGRDMPDILWWACRICVWGKTLIETVTFTI